MMSFPPARTWPSFLACTGFQAVVYFLCFHRRGPELAKRGPTILGWWLKRSNRDVAGAVAGGDSEPARIKIAPPTSVAQSWRLGGLHERFSRGSCAGEESTLLEAGEVLGRPLTEEEFLSLARVTERTAHRPRWCCNISDCMLVTGVIGGICTIGPAVYYLTTPIHSTLGQIITAMGDFVRATPVVLLCLFTLTVSLALVCDGFRAADHSVGGRIALTGILGAVGSLYYSTMRDVWGDSCAPAAKEVIMFGFSAVALVPITAKFDFALGGFIAAVSTVHCGFFAALASSIVRNPAWAFALGSLMVDMVFGLAVVGSVPHRTLQPFSSGVMAMGVSFLHFMLFVVSFEHSFQFWYKISIFPHMVFQLPVYVCLAASWALGEHVGCKGLTNNTRLFGVLYVFATIISRGGSAVGWAIVSLGAWRVGLYLHGHKDFVSSLWTLDAGLIRCNGCWGSNSSEDTANGVDDGNTHGSRDVDPLLGEGPVFESEMCTPRNSV